MHSIQGYPYRFWHGGDTWGDRSPPMPKSVRVTLNGGALASKLAKIVKKQKKSQFCDMDKGVLKFVNPLLFHQYWYIRNGIGIGYRYLYQFLFGIIYRYDLNPDIGIGNGTNHCLVSVSLVSISVLSVSVLRVLVSVWYWYQVPGTS